MKCENVRYALTRRFEILAPDTWCKNIRAHQKISMVPPEFRIGSGLKITEPRLLLDYEQSGII